jgi:transposase
MNSAINPVNETRTFLIKIATNDWRKGVRLRANIVLSSLEGFSTPEIARRLGCCVKTVRKWIKSWNNEGIGALVTWRHPSAIEKMVKRRRMLDHLIQFSPEKLKLEFTTWSLKTIQAFVEDHLGLNLSTTTILRDLRLLNACYRKNKDIFHWKPLDYDLKRAQLEILRRFSPPTTRLVFVDEKGPVHAVRYNGHQWCFNQPVREVRQKSRGKIAFLGGYDPNTEQLEMFPLEDLTAFSFCQTMELIKMVFLKNNYNRLLIILDNASRHRAFQTMEYFDNDPQIDYFFLPAYSPELNPIERCFGSYTRECLNNGTFYSKNDVIERTTSYCHYFNTLRREIHA